MIIIRGTTPTMTFDLPVDANSIAEAFVTIAQCNSVVIDKSLADCKIEEKKLSVTLTQIETLALVHEFPAEGQIRLKTIDGNAPASFVFDITVGKVLKGEVI